MKIVQMVCEDTASSLADTQWASGRTAGVAVILQDRASLEEEAEPSQCLTFV